LQKTGGGRMSLGCSQKSPKKKRWGTHVSRVLSKITPKTVIVVVVVVVIIIIVTNAIYSIYNIDMYICPGQLPPEQLPPEQIIVETINPVM
jgi:hypothetical protein